MAVASTLGAVISVNNGVTVHVVSVAGTDPIQSRTINNDDFSPGLPAKGIGFAWLTDTNDVTLSGGTIDFTDPTNIVVTPPTTAAYKVRCLLIG